MELKYYMINGYNALLIAFQSYLYGIEINSTLRDISEEKGFNRTFMELKSIISRFNIYNSKSFNRTFMELKYCILEHLLVVAWSFQSYLYGIEIIQRYKTFAR